MEMPDVIYAGKDDVEEYTFWFQMDKDNEFDKYHHDRILKAKDARIAELEAYIESRGYQAP